MLNKSLRMARWQEKHNWLQHTLVANGPREELPLNLNKPCSPVQATDLCSAETHLFQLFGSFAVALLEKVCFFTHGDLGVSREALSLWPIGFRMWVCSGAV